MQDVFISYSSRELAEAETVRMMLQERGISCWMAPGSIPGGSNYTKEIPVAIRECPVFVLVLSENAQKSHWVLKELDAAVGHGKVILPFMLEKFTLNDEFSFLLSGVQWFAAYQDADDALDKMVERIKAITSGKVPSPRPAPLRPRPVPRVEHKPKPEPVPQSEVKTEHHILCHACGSDDLQPLENGKKSYSPLESACFLLVPSVMLLSPLALYLLGYVVYHSLWSSDYLGIITFVVCFLSVPVAYFLSSRFVREQIRRTRIRKHIKSFGIRCRNCGKKFRITAPIETVFPWENMQ